VRGDREQHHDLGPRVEGACACEGFGARFGGCSLSTTQVCVDEFKPTFAAERSKKAVPIQCISLAWSADGTTLFAGYTDNIIRVWSVGQA
jgi:hypothetical protein